MRNQPSAQCGSAPGTGSVCVVVEQTKLLVTVGRRLSIVASNDGCTYLQYNEVKTNKSTKEGGNGNPGAIEIDAPRHEGKEGSEGTAKRYNPNINVLAPGL